MIRSNDFLDTYTVLKKLKSLSGNAQLEYLSEHLNSLYYLQITLHFLLNNSFITHLSSKKLSKELGDFEDLKPIKDYMSFINFLSTNVDGTDYSVYRIQQFVKKYSEEEQKMLLEIAGKTLSVNLGVPGYNKVAKKLKIDTIPQFKVQLGTGLDNVKDKDFPSNFTITEKLDGIRCICIYSNHKIKMFSRSGKLFEGFNQVEEDILALLGSFNEDIVLDGELLSIEKIGKAEDTFRNTSSRVSSKGEKTGIAYNIFDVLSRDAFFENEESKKYEGRRKDLSILNNRIKLNNLQFVNIVPVLYTGSDKEEIHKILSSYVADGAEGIMINDNEATYQNKRTKSLIKVKQSYESDGRITGFFEGKGEFEGTLGGIYVTYKNIILAIGSGFSKSDRDNIWNNQEAYLNRIASYKFTTESKDDDGNLKSVRFARFIRMRFDKNEVSYNN